MKLPNWSQLTKVWSEDDAAPDAERLYPAYARIVGESLNTANRPKHDAGDAEFYDMGNGYIVCCSYRGNNEIRRYPTNADVLLAVKMVRAHQREKHPVASDDKLTGGVLACEAASIIHGEDVICSVCENHPDRIQQLIRAAALLVSEIERINRARAKTYAEHDERKRTIKPEYK